MAAVRPVEAPGDLNTAAALHMASQTSPPRPAGFSLNAGSSTSRVLGSMVEVSDSLRSAVAIAQLAAEEEKREQRNQARQIARDSLAKILRRQPGIYAALGQRSWVLGKSSTDAELLRAWSLVDSVPKLLRTTGCKPRDIVTIEHLTQIAYRPPEPPKPMSQDERDTIMLRAQGRWLLVVAWVLAGLLLVIALILVLIFAIRMHEKAGWIYGKCEISKFSAGHGNCSDKACGFDVFAWPEDERLHIPERARRASNWKMPITMGEDTTSEPYVAGNAFSCCNLENVECCAWFDKSTELYCDGWIHRTDREGLACPQTPWSCRFQLFEGSEDVERLEELSDGVPQHWLLGGPAITLVVVAAVVVAYTQRSDFRLLMYRRGARIAKYYERATEQDQDVTDVKLSDLEIAQLQLEDQHAWDPKLAAVFEAQQGGKSRNSRPLAHRSHLLLHRPPEPPEPPEPMTNRLSLVSQGGSTKRADKRRGAFAGVSSRSQLGSLRRSAQAELEDVEDVKDVEVIDIQHDPRPYTHFHFDGLEASVAQVNQLLRPIVTPLPPRPPRSKRHKGGQKAQSWVHTDAALVTESPRKPQGKEAWRVVDL